MIVTLLANGFEEVEALTPIDILRRAGFEVYSVGISGKTVVGSHNIEVIADHTPATLPDKKIELLFLPGGMPGAKNLDESEVVDTLIKKTENEGGRLAAICAAPFILGKRGLLENKRACCYPGFENYLSGATVVTDGVVTDGNITTARGAGVALDFALELLCLLKDEEIANKMAATIIKG